MSIATQSLVIFGAAGLVSWMLAGLISMVSYRYVFKSATGPSALCSTALFLLGAILEAVMVLGLIVRV